LAVIALGVFVLVDLALFGWLIFRTLSQREIDRIVLETRAEAEVVADQIARDVDRLGQDLLMAVATNSDTRTYIDSMLEKREEVQMVRVLDREGRVVYMDARVERFGRPEGASTNFEPESKLTLPSDLENGELAQLSEFPRIVTQHIEENTPYEMVSVPVGEVGSVLIGLRREEIEQRLEELRGDLVGQAGSIGALTILVFAGAALLLWVVFRRSRKLEETAQEAERMAYVGTLASGLAHEIRSPLNSLNLNMQLLEEDLVSGVGVAAAGNSGSGRLLEITRSEITRLERLVSDFLRYARPRQLELQKVSCGELLEHARSVLRGHAVRLGAQIDVLDATAGASVKVDREQFQQLLLNLCENALQAVREGVDPHLQLLAERRGEGLVALGVRDHGVGMSSEEIAHATELFYSQRRGGTGLGLAIVDRIARAHGGTLQFESVLGEGTTVWVELPAIL
jgi:signal transduction histidine kinase